MSYPTYPAAPIPRDYRVTGTKPPEPQQQPIQPQVKKASTTLGINDAQLFWITLGLHGVLIGIEVWLAYKQNWLKI